MPKRKGVSPVIAVLLLVAIAVAIGILTYMWVTGIMAAAKAGVGEPTVYKLTVLWYNATDIVPPIVFDVMVKNIGHTNITIAHLHFAGVPVAAFTIPATLPNDIAPFEEQRFKFTVPFTVTPGVAYEVTFITTDGARFGFTVVAGRRA